MRIGLPHPLKDYDSYVTGVVPAHDGTLQDQVRTSNCHGESLILSMWRVTKNR
jgi:hypothetical protein